ncbi:MAG: GMC family oxidoreductase [Bryobacteraceae bacterium]
MPAPYRTRDSVDFLVIGSGAAGGVVAKELATAGFDVVVLEQGPYLKEKDFTHDEIKFGFQGFLVNDPKTQPQTFRETAAAVAKPELRLGYGRQVGGGTVHYNANYWRFMPFDFRERSLWGEISGTGFADWPIRYDELELYYTKAEYEIGVSGLAGAHPFEAPRSKPYPLPPMPVKSSGVLFERGARKLGLHPFPAPVAIISRNYKGRLACQHCGYCPRFGCEFGSKSSSLATVIRMAERTRRCEVRSGCYVSRIETNAAGRVTGAAYFDPARKEQFQRAKAVVVCANGAETPRLLLLSASGRFPHGLANSSGLVGKFLMYDLGTEARALFEHPLNEYKSIDVTRVLFDYYAADAKRGFYGGGGIDARFATNPIAHALYGLPPDLPQWGAEWKKAAGEYFTHSMCSLAHTTSLPVESNCVDLDPKLKDAWGLPALRVTYKRHPDDVATMRFMLARQREILEAAGARRVWDSGSDDLSYSVHHMGTCRMGDDPARSVVDKFHRTHDVKNLFLVDGSSFVTSGRQQPTATIQALAYRASEYMVGAARRGEM